MALPAQDFSVLEELHRSSGGTVYLGRRLSTGERVVLKERIKDMIKEGECTPRYYVTDEPSGSLSTS